MKIRSGFVSNSSSSSFIIVGTVDEKACKQAWAIHKKLKIVPEEQDSKYYSSYKRDGLHFFLSRDEETGEYNGFYYIGVDGIASDKDPEVCEGSISIDVLMESLPKLRTEVRELQIGRAHV